MTTSSKTKTPATRSTDGETVDEALGDGYYAGEGTDPIVDDRPLEEQPGTTEHLGSEELPYAGARQKTDK